MEYTKTVWKDLPDTSTPITASRLNNIEDGVEYLFENSEAGIEIKNEYSNLQNSVYSCNYVNNINTYSTNETRIGTWTDNKPLYRKVYIENNPTTGSWAYINTDNTYNIKMYKGFYQRNDNRLDALSAGREDYTPLICTIRNNQIEYKIDSTYASGKISVYFILEYTKTTD